MILTIKNKFFEVFGAINTFSYDGFAWNTYLNYAIPRIVNATNIIQQAEKQRKSLSIEELQQELAFVEDYSSQFTKIEPLLENAHNDELKAILLDFIAAVRRYQSALEDEIENKMLFYNAQLNQARLVAKYLD